MTHEHVIPWTGSLQQCPSCGTWLQATTCHDDQTGDTWVTWEPIEESA